MFVPTIPLAKITEFSLQQIFDEVVAHLRKQGRKSFQYTDTDTNNKICMYKTTNGLRCAAGVLLSDEEIDTFQLEGKSVALVYEVLTKVDAEIIIVPINKIPQIRLLRELQNIHDNNEVYEWEYEFSTTAFTFGLNYESPKHSAE